MLGRREQQESFFDSEIFSRMVPEDHPLELIKRHVDLSFVEECQGRGAVAKLVQGGPHGRRITLLGEQAMMGRKDFHGKWFYNFSLEDRVPRDHLVRLVAKAVDFSFVRGLVRHTYSHTGAPSVDPVVVFKMALLGYLYGITSERRLAEEVRLNLAYMWFLGYDIDETPPDHSILSKARARYGPQAYRQFFSEVVRKCREAGLIDGDRVSVLIQKGAV